VPVQVVEKNEPEFNDSLQLDDMPPTLSVIPEGIVI
jgi:hypothetical protein